MQTHSSVGDILIHTITYVFYSLVKYSLKYDPYVKYNESISKQLYLKLKNKILVEWRYILFLDYLQHILWTITL